MDAFCYTSAPIVAVAFCLATALRRISQPTGKNHASDIVFPEHLCSALFVQNHCIRVGCNLPQCKCLLVQRLLRGGKFWYPCSTYPPVLVQALTLHTSLGDLKLELYAPKQPDLALCSESWRKNSDTRDELFFSCLGFLLHFISLLPLTPQHLFPTAITCCVCVQVL